MLVDHIDRAVRETCPFMRTTCTLAILGKCAPVNLWHYDHHAKKPVPVFLTEEQVQDARRRGGKTSQDRQQIYKEFLEAVNA